MVRVDGAGRPESAKKGGHSEPGNERRVGIVAEVPQPLSSGHRFFDLPGKLTHGLKGSPFGIRHGQAQEKLRARPDVGRTMGKKLPESLRWTRSVGFQSLLDSLGGGLQDRAMETGLGPEVVEEELLVYARASSYSGHTSTGKRM